MSGTDHSKALAAAIEKARITQRRAAELILLYSREQAQERDIELMHRRVRAWLASKGTEDKARCPGWAVVILELALKELRK